MSTQHVVLDMEIEAAPLSQEFKFMAQWNAFVTFGELVEYGVRRIPKLPYGGYRMLVELLGFFDEKGLLGILE